jgi:anaerobic magnesium-protoporphyrin IX monomethyl ester cyclase
LASLGVREVYFNDQTFGAQKERTLDLCRAMAKGRLNFGWTCFTRADVVDDKFVEAMKSAGCHTVTFGVESANDAVRAASGKGISRHHIERAFEMCHAQGMDAAATFIMGLPDETEEDLRASAALAVKLGCDFASFNIAVPRMRTWLRHEAITLGLVNPHMTKMDQSGTYAVMGTRHLSREETEHLLAQAIREFYFRPSYILGRLRRIRSLQDLRRHVVCALAVIQNLLKR